MGWFDNVGFQSPNPDGLTDAEKASYDYKTAQAAQLRKQALAQAFLKDSLTPQQGQMVSDGTKNGGWYVKPSALSVLAKVAQAALSNYALNQSDKDMKTIDDQAQSARSFQLSHLGDQVSMSPDQASQADRDAKQAAIAQADAQQAAVEKAARSQQLNTPPTVITQSPPASPPSAPAAAPTAPQPMPSAPVSPINAPTVGSKPKLPLDTVVKALNGDSKVSEADVAALPPELTGAPASTPVPPAAQKPIAKPIAAALLSNQPLPQATVPDLTVAPVDAQASPLPGNAGYDYQTPQGQSVGPKMPAVSHMRTPDQAEVLARLDALSRTGSQGQATAQALTQQLFGQKGEWKPQAVKNADGSESLVLVNTQSGQIKPGIATTGFGDKVLETKDTPNGIMERTVNGWRPARTADGQPVMGTEHQKVTESQNEKEQVYQGAKAGYETALAKLNSVIGDPSKVRDAKGDVLNNVTAHLPWGTDTAAARSQIKEAMASMVLGTQQALKAGGVGVGAFNSDAEGRRLESAVADIDFTHLDGPALMAKLNSVRQLAQDALARLDAARAKNVNPQNQTNPQANGGGRGVLKFD